MVDSSALGRRRELARLSKPELIDLLIDLEKTLLGVEGLLRSLDAAFGDEP